MLPLLHLAADSEQARVTHTRTLASIAPKFSGFAVSFFTVAIFWVNHHQFFGRIEHVDWKLMR